MFKLIRNLLRKKYGIQAEEEFREGKYEACRSGDQIYTLVPIGTMDEEELSELGKMAEHLVNSGDKYVSIFVRMEDGKPFCEWENSRYCVLKNQYGQRQKLDRFGRKLAKFHFRGRTVSFPVKKTSRIGQWKKLWETRLDQMERVWNEMLFQQPENEFERMFLESFPYYMGMAENAIQYLVDTELDDDPNNFDSGTICHERLTPDTWGKSSFFIKNPFDWVFDHQSRDLSEWTRGIYFNNIKTYEPELRKFIADYHSIAPLSSFSWRLYYARLLFPLHFFDCIETYYGTNSEQQKRILEENLNKFLQQTNEHESFLGNFYELLGVPVHKWKIPIINWLGK